jgi:hypothetical protein
MSRYAAPLLGIVAVVGFANRLHAQISLSTANDNQSSVSASANSIDAQAFPPQTVNNVNSLPFTTPTTATAGNSSSEVDSNLTSSSLGFTFTDSSSDDGYYMSGFGSVYFTAAPGTNFSIAGGLSSDGYDYEATISVDLYDVTQGFTEVYGYYGDGYYYPDENSIFPESPVAFTLDGSQGTPTSGTLNAGDQYWFSAQETLTNEGEPTLNGNVSISFAPSSAVPLPGSAEASLVMIGVLATGMIWRRVRRPA